jgi:hypothetical protein
MEDLDPCPDSNPFAVCQQPIPLEAVQMWTVSLLREKLILPGSISSKISHIKKAFNKFGRPHFLDTKQWAAFMGCVHLSKPHIPAKARPITVELIVEMDRVCKTRARKSRAGSPDHNSVWCRLMVIVIVAFAGFLRINEALHLTVGRVRFLSDHMILAFEGDFARKGDRFRQGGQVFIAATNGPFCPVRILRNWVSGMNGAAAEAPLFPGQGISGVISYECIRIQLRDVFKELGLDTAVFRTHSMRVGGATAAAAAGVSNDLAAKHGGWMDLFAFHGYVELCLRDRLIPSLALDL